MHDEPTDDERVEQINEQLASIRELCGSIQANVENLDPDATDDELTDLYEWCDNVSAQTYRYSDEDANFAVPRHVLE